jgi:predicted metalloprotease with PDZ domain
MNDFPLRSTAFLLWLLAALPAVAASPKLSVEVDARELGRSLLHAKVALPAKAGNFTVWYPKWIPGVHAPGGPVANVGGLRFLAPNGEQLVWKRDEEEPFRFHVTVPQGVDRVIGELDYICNQPTENSSGVDSFGNSLLGVINWNTVLLYPESADIDQTMAQVHLTLPEGWRFGTALKTEQPGATVTFAADTLRRVVDSPLVCGKYLREIELTGKRTPPAFMHVVSESEAAIQFDDALIARYRALVAEALALFGVAHFDSYHFLLVCSDQVPRNGLEHMASSFNSVAEREIIEEKKRKGWPAYLLPHEFVHSWCGKYRRPAAMVTTNFHTAERTPLLWIYEGLTQYLGEVLTVRAGLLKTDEFVPQFASKIDWLMRQSGRSWRSVEDTATSSWQLRARSPLWPQLRRGQDYYDEGMVAWLEADAIIRQQTGGKRSLDDFCKTFFATQPKTPPVAGYELDEVLGILKQIADYDWPKFFAERIQQPRQELGLGFLEAIGYRVQYAPKQSEYSKERDLERRSTNAQASLGLGVSDDGKVTLVVPGMPADKSKLAAGMTVVGVNSRKFSGQRLRDAIADSVANRGVELLILEGDTFRTVKVDYTEGSKYLELIQRPDRPDVLGAIVKPTVKD